MGGLRCGRATRAAIATHAPRHTNQAGASNEAPGDGGVRPSKHVGPEGPHQVFSRGAGRNDHPLPLMPQPATQAPSGPADCVVDRLAIFVPPEITLTTMGAPSAKVVVESVLLRTALACRSG